MNSNDNDVRIQIEDRPRRRPLPGGRKRMSLQHWVRNSIIREIERRQDLNCIRPEVAHRLLPCVGLMVDIMLDAQRYERYRIDEVN
jgi:hypothetical protein